ncbi:MAG: transcriptional coactivator p15/PC4 family protein [Pseudomonadota bacterium]
MTEPAVINKNSREQIRVSLDDFRGHQLVNMRVWYDAGEGEMRPGKQGLALRSELLPHLINALEQLAGGKSRGAPDGG